MSDGHEKPTDKKRRKRHKNSRHNGATGKPERSKDRTSHTEARGVKSVSLSDLAKQLPTEEEIQNYNALVASESDRGAAIMVGAYVETALWFAINCCTPNVGPELSPAYSPAG